MTNTLVMASLRHQYETSGCRLTHNRLSQNLVLFSDSGSNPPAPTHIHTHTHTNVKCWPENIQKPKNYYLINLLLSQSFAVAQNQSQTHRWVMLKIHLRPGLRLRMSGAIRPLPPPPTCLHIVDRETNNIGDWLFRAKLHPNREIKCIRTIGN